MRKIVWFVQLISLVVLAGCSSSKPSDMPPLSETGLLSEYRIGVGDSIQINVWRNPELSLAVPVRPDGKVSMPLIGDILAANQTATELSAAITTGLSSYVRNPQVTVIVANPSSSDFQRRVRITGAVRAPQSIPYREGMTVLDLVLMAGGPNEFADDTRIFVVRQYPKFQRIRFTYEAIMSNENGAATFPLRTGDVLVIE